MKWTGMYLIGYVVFVVGVILALWRSGILERIGTAWTIIGLVIAIGIGIMMSVSSSGEKQSVEIDRH